MSNEEELARLKQKCEAKIRELKQRHKLEIAVKDTEIQDSRQEIAVKDKEIQGCRQEIAVKDSKIQDYREQIEYLRKLNMSLPVSNCIFRAGETPTPRRFFASIKMTAQLTARIFSAAYYQPIANDGSARSSPAWD